MDRRRLNIDCEVALRNYVIANLNKEIEELSSAVDTPRSNDVRQWLVPLQDIAVKERESAKFVCEFSIPNVKVIWKVKGDEVESSPKFAIQSDENSHILLVSKCRPTDAGPVTCSYGDITTEANLTVKEIDVEFTVPLKEQIVPEQSNVEFFCELNIDTDVTWYLDEDKLSPLLQNGIDISKEGLQHKLTIKDVSAEDNGVVKVFARGKSSQAKLVVGELGPDFAVPLSDVFVTEKATGEMMCELTKDVPKMSDLDDLEIIILTKEMICQKLAMEMQELQEQEASQCPRRKATKESFSMLSHIVGDREVMERNYLLLTKKLLYQTLKADLKRLKDKSKIELQHDVIRPTSEALLPGKQGAETQDNPERRQIQSAMPSGVGDHVSPQSSANQPIFSPDQEAKGQLPFNFEQQSMIQTVPQQQQVPQQHPQWAPYVLPWQPQQLQPQTGQTSLPWSQQYEMTGSKASVQKPYEPALGSQPSTQQIPPQQWPQSQFTGHGHVPQGQDQTSKSQTPSLVPALPNQTYSATGYGMQTLQQQVVPHQYQPQQQSSQGPAPSAAQTGFSEGYTGAVPQEVGSAGTKMGGTSQLMDVIGVGGSQQMGVVNVQRGIISDQSEANQQGMLVHQTDSPHQSPSRAAQSGQGQERVPVISVGYLYAEGQHQGPFVADYDHPNQHLYQNMGTTAYQPNQPYSGGYQHGIDRSYQHAQTFGTFTSKANVYGQSNQPISVQSQNVNTQYVMSHGQGSSLQAQNIQQPGQGPQIQSQIHGSTFLDQNQGPPLQAQTHGLQLQSQTLGSQIQSQVHESTFPDQNQGPPLQFQQPTQQFQPQPGRHQQPGIVTPPQQFFQPQQQQMIQPQLQQLVGPYNPQRQMPIPGASNQFSFSAGEHKGDREIHISRFDSSGIIRRPIFYTGTFGYRAEELSAKIYDGVLNSAPLTRCTSAPCCKFIYNYLNTTEKGVILDQTAPLNCVSSPGSGCGIGDQGCPAYCKNRGGERVVVGLAASTPCEIGGHSSYMI